MNTKLNNNRRPPTGGSSTAPVRRKPLAVKTIFVVANCGHEVPFEIYADYQDKYRTQRRANAEKRPCPTCRQKAHIEHIAKSKEEARLKRLATRGWFGRLPANSYYKTLQWNGKHWSGSLYIPMSTEVPGFPNVEITEPLIFNANTANSLRTLINRLDKQYRQWLVPKIREARRNEKK